MAGECDAAIAMTLLDIAITIVTMSYILTAAIAGDVLKHLWMRDGVTVCLLDLH
jgi:hypothetical protein